MTRILHIIQRLSSGGAARSLITMAHYSRRLNGFHHRVISIVAAEHLSRENAELSGISVINAPDHKTITDEIDRADIVQVHFWNTPEIYELLRAEWPPMRLLVRLNIGGNYPPHVVTKDLIHFCDCCAAGTPYTLALPVFEQLPKKTKDKKTRLLYPAADFERLAGAERRPHRTFNVGYIGTVDFTKMHPNYVRMCARIQIPSVRFIVCGGGAGYAQLRREGQEHGLLDRMEFRGYVEDIKSALEEFDVFGYPLREDNYSSAESALHEAMYVGVPPVILAHGGAQQTVLNRHTGLIAESEPDYKAAIEYLYHNPKERARMGQNGKVYARLHFGAKNTAKQLHRIYADLLGMPKSRHLWPRDRSLESKPLGAAAFVESLGDMAPQFKCSLTSKNTEELIGAEQRIASSSPVLCSASGGGVIHYRNYYREDPYLRLWSGLVLRGQGQNIRAISEFKAAIDLGCDHWRVQWYLAQAGDGVGSSRTVLEALREVVHAAPDFADARVMLQHWEGRGYA